MQQDVNINKNVLCGFTSLQMCLLWKFSMPFLMKLASSLKGIQLLKDCSPHCQRNHWQKFGVSKNEMDLERVAVSNVTGTTTTHREPTTLLCMTHVWQLAFDKLWCGDSPLYVSVCALPHQLFMHFSILRSLL
jgi:hypothetical protein